MTIKWVVPSEMQEAALMYARGELDRHVREIGTTNTGVRVNQYLASVKMPPGNPWCAAFVSWCIQMAEQDLSASSTVIRSAYTPDYLRCEGARINSKLNGVISLSGGTLFLLYFKKMMRVAHIGFIVGQDPNDSERVLTIEGNSNDDGAREGYEVCQRSRRIKDLYATVNY